MMTQHCTAAVAFALVFAGSACSQETAPDSAVEATPVSSESGSGGFNLSIPGETPAESSGGFNLSIPGEEQPSFRLPDDAVSNNAFNDLPEISAPVDDAEDAAPVEDEEIIRLDP